MPKMKSHRGAAKRFRRTGSGKLTHQRRNKRHILTKKTTKRKRQLRQKNVVAKGDQKKLDQLVPYL
ncbi:MAG: 50S ribosomal protein L35 [Myxococcota bacterium]